MRIKLFKKGPIFEFGEDKRKTKIIEELRKENKQLKEQLKKYMNIESRCEDLEKTMQFKNLVEEVEKNVYVKKNSRKSIK